MAALDEPKAARDMPAPAPLAASEKSGYSAPANRSDPSEEQATTCFSVEDGVVMATVDAAVSDAAADLLWRVIDKAMGETEP
jgi:hypothetical protein